MVGGRGDAWLIVALTFALPVGIVVVYPSSAAGVVAGVFAGIPAGVLVSWLVYRLQRPVLVIEPIQGGTVGARNTYWVHFRVRNIGGGFLGGGTAHGVECRLAIWENPLPSSSKLEARGFVDNRAFTLKWDSRPDPIQQHVVGVAPGGGLATVATPDIKAFEEASLETIRSNRSKTVGAVFKMRGDPNAYVHMPEGFMFPDWKIPDCRFPPGKYAIEITVESEDTDRVSFPFELQCSPSVDVPTGFAMEDQPTLTLRPRANAGDYRGYSPWPFGH